MTDTKKSVGHIIDLLKEARDEPNMGCSLLIGAGCSVTAGIKPGQGFVEIIKKKFPNHYNDALEPKNYPRCMAELSKANQRKLVKDQIKDAKINWAHICIALLLKENYADRILTTNFDPLISRACALLGEFPAVYDFAASQTFKPEYVPEKAIFHLHGQHTGFDMLHDDKETNKFSRSLKPVFKDASQGRLWIVVGYSGECDPVFNDHLSKVKEFECGLYWVGYKDNLPGHVKDKLLNKSKNAFHIPGHDADSFFIELTRGLKIFPPELITQPFHHLNKLFNGIQPFPSRKDLAEKDVTETARQQIRQAIKNAEKENQNLIAEANRLLMSGDNKATLNFINKNKIAHGSPEFLDIEAWAFIGQGIHFSNLAKTQSGAKQQATFKLADDKYQQAIKVKPDRHEAFYNWGITLADLAQTQRGAKQQATFKLAGDKYQQAIKIKPDKYQALNNWGLALYDLAQTQSGAKQQATFKLAGDKYQQAIKIKPDLHEALSNWGLALAGLTQTQSGAKQQATFKLAGDKYQQAIKIKPDLHEALINWGLALAGLAQTQSGVKQQTTFKLAGDKYQQAIQFKPDYLKAFYNWGIVLDVLARTQSGTKQQSTFKLAGDKYQKAIKLKPDYHGAFFNLACLEALLGNETECRKWLKKRVKIEPLTKEDINDSDFDSVRDKAWFKKLIS
jgi:Tfp pilus assembly protein PilF/NAD-dependent SIR2 family protein deacetylase